LEQFVHVNKNIDFDLNEIIKTKMATVKESKTSEKINRIKDI
jgi:hypothetical protein